MQAASDAAMAALLPRIALANSCCRMNGTHIEKPCNEVRDPHKSSIAARFDAEAAAWWQSVVAEPDSFTKPVYQLGLQGEEASNVEAEGAVQITRGSVTVSSRANYTRVGDNVCMKATVSVGAACKGNVVLCWLCMERAA